MNHSHFKLILAVILGGHIFAIGVVTLIGGWLLQELAEIRKQNMKGRVIPRVVGLLAAQFFLFIGSTILIQEIAA